MEEDNLPIPEDASELEFIQQEQDLAKFEAGYDKPIDRKFLDNYIGGRQMGYGADELQIIEDTAFSKIMDYMDANDIHYSDINVYDFIPEDKRLSPYLIFELGVRNEYYTDDFVEYMISVTRNGPSGIYDSNLEEVIDAPPTHHMAEYALKAAAAKGPEAKLIEQAKIIGGEYTDADLKKLKFAKFFEKVSMNVNPKKVKIKFVNNLFPGGSYEAYLEESQRRAMEKMGMTPEGDWLPEVKEKMIIKTTDVDGNVTYKDFYGKEVSPDDPRISDKSKLEDLEEQFKTPMEDLSEEEQIKRMVDEGILTEREGQQALNKEGNWAEKSTDLSDELPLLETRMKKSVQDSLEWADDVIKPNKVFNPDSLTKLVTPEGEPHSGLDDPGKYVWTKTRNFDAQEMYRRIINGRASDEDITKFFIYLASHSPQSAYANNPFNRQHSIADIVKIGIFSDIPLTDVIPMGVPNQEAIFLNELTSNNSEIGDEINKVLVQLVTEQGQFYDLRERMRKVIMDAHQAVYANNPNDYFILWRGGDLNRFHPWQSFSKSNLSATGVMYQMVQAGFGGGRKVGSYVIHKNNMIDLDALGLSHMNEKEVIVLTEEAKSPLSLRSNIEELKDIARINEWWLTARTETTAFPKDGMKITNISQPLTDAGQSTQQFFNTVIEGGDPRYMPKTAYQQLIDLNNSEIYRFQDDYNKFIAEGGNFNQHIFTSIPTFYEAQVVKMAALSFLINNNPLDVGEFGGPAQPYRILDIGGTEGAWAKALAKNNPLVNIEVLDPSAQAKEIFDNRNLITNAKFTQQAFSHKLEDQGTYFKGTGGGKPIKFADYTKLDGMNKYDIVHESMALQFMDNDRAGQIKYIKANLLNENGILIIEEKFLDDNTTIYNANEAKKDNFKRQYYTEEQLNNKKFNVLLNMEGKQVSVQEMNNILGENFAYVDQYWDAGNFKGFIASDSPVIESFKTGIGELDVSLTNHQYSTSPTNPELKASINKITYNHGTDTKLAGQLASDTVAKNPRFFNSINRAMARLGIAGGAALSAVSRVSPYLAPGDLFIEKALEKVVPYLDDAAARLGFGRISFGQILPTYIAYEIGVAAADTIQAAMYAYDASQQKAPQQPGKLQTTLTRILLPKALEEEAIKRSQVPGDLQAFYNTPTGQKVVEELDFGSQFMRELDKEKISKYSPGWGLTKGLLTLLATPTEKSDYNYTDKYEVSR